VVGNDAAITFGGAFGNFELNVMIPLIAHNLLQSITLLSHGASVFARRCVIGLEADAERCAATIERSLAMGTALAPAIGYDAATAIVKRAYETGRTIREVASETAGLSDDALAELLDPRRQTQPGGPGRDAS
jgi:fumarate hydratase class II